MAEIKFTKCKCCVVPGKFDIEDISLDCEATWKLISGGYTVGIFQIEKKLGQDWSRKVKPNNIEELAALVSLLRPGPLESLMSQQYVDVKSGKKQLEYLHDSLAPILSTTYGCLVYQEQALKIAVEIAGFSPENADTLRKAIGKKLPKLMAELKQKFVVGAKKQGVVTTEVAEEIFSWIEKCQRYSFNKCVSSDTIIQRFANNQHNQVFSVEEMFEIMHQNTLKGQKLKTGLRSNWLKQGHYGYGLSMCQDGQVRKNIIRDIKPAGKQQLYKIVLENGHEIRVTINHKFPTHRGELRLIDIKIGDKIYVSERQKGHAISKKENSHMAKFYGSPKLKEFKKRAYRCCWKCGETDTLEIHHKDKNYENNEWSNLEVVCVSCHKNIHQNNIKNNPGDKGWQTTLIAIQSIQKDAIEDTWDVTMDSPNHNFVVNGGIITSNSHAVSYAKIAFQTAWMKCHFPHEFFTSWLTYSHYKSDPKDEIYKLVQDARLFNVPILSPDIRRCNVHFKIVETPIKSVAFGLAHIRSVGQSAIKKIVESASGSLGTWWEFLASVPDFHRNVGVALIKAGACDCYGLSRSQMIHELEVILGATIINDEGNKKEIKGLTKRERDWLFEQCSDTQSMANVLSEMSQDPQDKPLRLSQMKKPQLVGLGCSLSETMPEKATVEISKLTKPKLIDLIVGCGYQDPDAKTILITENRRSILAEKASLVAKQLEDTNTSKAMAEKHFLGIALTCSPADDAETDLATHTCLDVARAFNEESITVCAIIDRVTHTKTKRGKNPGQSMCFITISDSTYSTDAVVFPQAYDKNKAFCHKDSIVLIYGKKQNRSFIVSEIQKLI